MGGVRPEKDDYYLGIAQQVAMRSTCLRRKFGAVIVGHDQIISTGYCGPPRRTTNCHEVGFCLRNSLGARPGEHYEFCRAVHAEQNAIIQANRLDMVGSRLYLVGLNADDNEPLAFAEPCRLCKRFIVNAGIKQVVCRHGEDVKKYSVKDWIDHDLYEIQKVDGRLIPVEAPQFLAEPIDAGLSKKLIERFGLSDAIVVRTEAVEVAHAVARVAGRYLVDNVKDGDSVGLSCGETILSMIESLPRMSSRRIDACQLSVEGDPEMIHQAPATLVGMLRSKSSSASSVVGLQLPPVGDQSFADDLRDTFAASEQFQQMKETALACDYLFLGVGTANVESPAFWRLANRATGGLFFEESERLGIVGEINNRPYDASGRDCTEDVTGLSKHALSVITLDDIRRLSRQSDKHRVVLVVGGEHKTTAVRAALDSGIGNVIITGRDDAKVLLR